MPYHVFNEAGELVGYLENDAEIDQWMASLPDDLYGFPVGGYPDDATRFMLRLNTKAASGKSFIDLLKERYGRVPLELNPFKEVKDLLLGNNAFFIKLRNFIDMPLVSQLLGVLRRTLPAGVTFFLIMEPSGLAEDDTPPVLESLGAFYAPSVADRVDAGTAVTLASAVIQG